MKTLTSGHPGTQSSHTAWCQNTEPARSIQRQEGSPTEEDSQGTAEFSRSGNGNAEGRASIYLRKLRENLLNHQNSFWNTIIKLSLEGIKTLPDKPKRVYQ